MCAENLHTDDEDIACLAHCDFVFDFWKSLFVGHPESHCELGLVDCPTQQTDVIRICQLCSMTNISEKYERTQQGNLLSWDIEFVVGFTFELFPCARQAYWPWLVKGWILMKFSGLFPARTISSAQSATKMWSAAARRDSKCHMLEGRFRFRGFCTQDPRKTRAMMMLKRG